MLSWCIFLYHFSISIIEPALLIIKQEMQRVHKEKVTNKLNTHIDSCYDM